MGIKVFHPEEDHELANTCVDILTGELLKRLKVGHPYVPSDMSFLAVSDKQLLHHIGIRLEQASGEAE